MRGRGREFRAGVWRPGVLRFPVALPDKRTYTRNSPCVATHDGIHAPPCPYDGYPYFPGEKPEAQKAAHLAYDH